MQPLAQGQCSRPHRLRGQSERDAEEIARHRTRSTLEHGLRVPPAPAAQQTVTVEPGEHAAAAGTLEHRRVEVSVRRPQKPMLRQSRARPRPEKVQFAADLDPHPVGHAQVADHELLPARLFRGRHIGEPKRDRDWSGEPSFTGDANRGRQDGRGVAATGETDDARLSI